MRLKDQGVLVGKVSYLSRRCECIKGRRAENLDLPTPFELFIALSLRALSLKS